MDWILDSDSHAPMAVLIYFVASDIPSLCILHVHVESQY
jgi:hypothetical protein